MSSHDPERPPERLIHGKYGSLLRQAKREWEWDVDEAAAFRRLADRLSSTQNERAVARKRWLFVATPTAIVALASALMWARAHGSDIAPEVVAETWRTPVLPSTQPPVSSVGAPALHPPLPRAEPRAAKREAEALAPRASASAAPPPSSPTAARAEQKAAAEPTPIASAAEPAPTPDCLGLARHGESRVAERCFLERAQGAGLAAEMALYELARLRRDVLADPNGALRALADYRTRFPAGSLRREVDMSQLELLLQLGRSDDALKQSDELLSSSTSERASELRLLRGHILRKQSRLPEAVREFELAERGGARASEAIYFRAVCLEAMGRAQDAVAAFSKYLEQPHRPYAEDAQRRLEKLK